VLNYLRKIKSIIKSELAQRKSHVLYQQQLIDFKKQLNTPIEIIELPCLNDNTQVTDVEPHYTYHPAWAARVLAQTKPAKHIDISSITSFTTIVSAFIPVEFYDYRPANIHISNYTSGRADLTNLHFETNSVESLSCMHTVEHIGLGRYGDLLDVDGDKKAMTELARVLAVGGTLLFVVPIGNERIEFNAHRVYTYDTIIKRFSGLVLKEFSLIPDDFENTGYITNPPIELINKQHWGCGCFWFTKK
jgi:SAM-dependent methyltransferase